MPNPTPPRPIALITRQPPAQEAALCALLAEQMPGEQIIPFADLTEEHRRQADIAIVANPDPAHLAALPHLVWIHSLWAGVERLIAELGPHAPPVARLIDPELARTMAEAVLAWTYYLHRDMPTYRLQQQDAVWRALPYRPPASVTVGLLGLGELGLAAAARLCDAGFTVQGWSRSAKSVAGIATLSGDDGLTTLLASSDIVVCLVPLTPQTRGLLDERRFGGMKRGAALINFARGPVVVAADLLQALTDGHLSHAVLDVFDQEPLPADSPLWRHPQVTVLPHISAPTDNQSAARIVAANIAAYRRTGALPQIVDRARGY